MSSDLAAVDPTIRSALRGFSFPLRSGSVFFLFSRVAIFPSMCYDETAKQTKYDSNCMCVYFYLSVKIQALSSRTSIRIVKVCLATIGAVFFVRSLWLRIFYFGGMTRVKSNRKNCLFHSLYRNFYESFQLMFHQQRSIRKHMGEHRQSAT